MKNFSLENTRLNMERLQQLIVSAEIETDKSADKLIGGFSQSLSIGIEDTISDGQSNNCNGANCHRHCGDYPPDTPVGPNTVCIF
ncbi:hypothetical protein SAMN06265171_102459 [Chryseobacterium rhizoplanae]|uniref:Uncharacterized protein n=2 Tax=Chryseobacterium TaxID=59732 RepID=A0A521C4V4_9FLAO|nr:hypothetical protein [Chryseobacterium rhizoplanae]SMO54438.1 hypothetical protein SAMN06265171_102459 [Chryseobacterium rhizoplanae]